MNERNDSMKDIQIFENEKFGSLRTIIEGEKILFVASDAAKMLGYTNTSKAVNDHCKGITKRYIPTNGGKQEVNVIPEGDLYRLIAHSEMPEAEKFEQWVFDDVLPSIRKHGGYLTPDKVEEVLLNPDTIIKLATALKEERAKVAEMQPKALFADAVSTSETSILVGELAKMIKQNGIDIGEKRLFEWMRGNGYLISRKGNDWNMPTQRSMNLGIMEIKERTVNNPDGSVRITKTPKVTGKGQVYFVNKFLSKETA